MVVLMLGTNDASASRTVDAFRADMEKAVDLILERGVSASSPPSRRTLGKPELAKHYNEALRQTGEGTHLPLIDYEKEILKRRPDDWNGTLLQKNDVHPTAEPGRRDGQLGADRREPRNSGYLLRGWLSVQKIAEVKKKVLDDKKE